MAQSLKVNALIALLAGFFVGCALLHAAGGMEPVSMAARPMQLANPRLRLQPEYTRAQNMQLVQASRRSEELAVTKREMMAAAAAAAVATSRVAEAEPGVTILDRDAQIFKEPYSPSVTKPIEEAEVLSVQKKWGEGIVEIGKLVGKPTEYTAKAQSVIDTLYGYKTGPVLFKPTKAAEKPFRLDTKAALSYFVSGNTAFPEDKGFALKPWTGVRFENNGVLLEGTTALAQGNYFFTDTDGKETKVEYTFGYFRDSEGQLRINLHHSSLPFKPA